ncbi:flagellar brake protein (plasmid) [Chromobacterium amazonense]|uniref:flagellar brake protein n=1 Tax=Chromobacterium amazonense TaxID=1382803 RepID=UPI000582E5CD|nr:flagellar brake protein [Chromobacterium amazonense]KIA81874.1 flagellar brake protein [Chromobacterium piscinae]MDE1714131.1 flagellar brake protein [Chromobacterium amazonense]
MSDDKTSVSPASAHQSLDLAKFTMTSPAEIAQHLTNIAKHGHMVTIFSNKGKNFILTKILDVDFKNGVFTVDWGAEEEANNQVLGSERNVFVCSPEGVKTQFVTGALSKVIVDGQPAFVADLPEQVIKLQRREFFRIQTPLGTPVFCHVEDYGQRPIDLALFDISVGGMSLWLPDVSTVGFDIGQQYHKCTLDLKPIGVLQIGIEVRHRLASRLRNDTEAMRIGCSYLNLTPKMETLIQRYVGFLERERRAMFG